MSTLTWYAALRDGLWLALAAKVVSGFLFSETADVVGPRVLAVQIVAIFAFAVALTPLYPRLRIVVPGSTVPGQTEQLEALPMLAGLLLAVWFLASWGLFGDGEYSLFIATVIVFVGAWFLLSSRPSTPSGAIVTREAVWLALLVAYLYMWARTLTGAVVVAVATAGAALLLAQAGKLFGPRAKALVLRLATQLAGGAAFYGLALVLVGAAFALAALVVFTLAFTVRRYWRSLRAWGWRPLPAGLVAGVLGLAVTAMVAVGLFAWAGFAGYVHRGLLDVGGRTQFDRGPLVVPEYDLADTLATAQAFAPFLVHAGDERWLPSRVEGYVKDAVLVDEEGRVRPATVILDPKADDARACRAPARRCTMWLTDCPPAGDVLCTRPPEERSGTGCGPTGVLCGARVPICRLPELQCAAPGERDDDRVVYARVVDDPWQRAGVSMQTRARLREPLRTLEAIVQYWVFYRYDDWVSWSFRGVHQWHDGDWESVSIGLGSDGPLFAAFSSHCGGSWIRWNRLETVPGRTSKRGYLVESEDGAPSHLVVYVARGSHALYATSTPRSPDFAACRDVPPLMQSAPRRARGRQGVAPSTSV